MNIEIKRKELEKRVASLRTAKEIKKMVDRAIKDCRLREDVVQAAKHWHLTPPVTYCRGKCTKHAGVCGLGKAVEKLIKFEKEMR